MRRATAALILLFVSGCHSHPPIVQTPPPPIHGVVALLPDPETNTVGKAVVTARTGESVELATTGAATRIVIGQPPSAHG